MEISGHEPIYPEALVIDKFGNTYLGSNYSNFTGLTIRQHFAAMCLQGLLSIHFAGDGIYSPIVPNEENINYMADLSVKASDALIKELNK